MNTIQNYLFVKPHIKYHKFASEDFIAHGILYPWSEGPSTEDVEYIECNL